MLISILSDHPGLLPRFFSDRAYIIINEQIAFSTVSHLAIDKPISASLICVADLERKLSQGKQGPFRQDCRD